MQDNGSVSPIRAFLRNKWVRLILIIDVIAIITVIGVIVWNATKSTMINFNVTPIDAKIQIDGSGEYSNGSYRVHPGTHEITISHDGLVTKTFTLDLQSGYNTTLTAFLSGEGNNFEFYELKDNYASFEQLAAIASADNNITTDQDTSAEQFIQDIEYALSILEILPIRGYVYVDSQPNNSPAGFAILDGLNEEKCEKVACLLVNYVREGAESAIMKKIEETGYDPVDYQIIYERLN